MRSGSSLLSIVFFLALPVAVEAQGLLTIPSGTQFTVQSGGTISMNGTLTVNNGGTLNNAGIITISRTGIPNADLTDNNSIPQNYGNGKFIITGAIGTQTVLGGIFYDLEINNTLGVSMLASETVNNSLILTNGSLSIGPNTLSVNGSITGTGKLKGSALSMLAIGGAAGTLNFDQTDSTTRSLKNLTFNSGSATLGNSMQVYQLLGLTSSTFHVNGQSLVLKSVGNGISNTARVGNLTGSILDGVTNITVERYIASPQRAWHLLGTQAVTGAQTIKQAWQENGGAIFAGQGTLVTSNLYNGTNGFDVASISSSILTHNQGGGAGPSWNYNLANTNATTISANRGYMLFVRGDRNYTAANSPSTSPTVLRTNGVLTQGNQPVFISSTGVGRTLVANPYASPIDMEPVFAGTTNLAQDMYVWDPSLTGTYGVGGFRLVQRTGPGVYQQTPVILGGASTDPTARYIHSGQAFLLRTTGTSGVTDATVNFTESTKAATVSVVNPFTQGPTDEQIIANLLIVNPGNIESLADGIRVQFDDSYTADTTDDVDKMGNFAENISSLRQGKKLIVENRPMITAQDTIFLRMTNIGIKNYRFEIGTLNFIQTGVVAFLQDLYLDTNTPIDLSGAVNDIDFSTNSDPLSSAQDRFRIVFKLSVPLPTSFIGIKAYQTAGPGGGQNTGVAVEWKIASETNMQHYEVERSTDGSNFSRIATQSATGNNGLDADYASLDPNPAQGNNFYRVRAVSNSGEIKYSAVVRVTIAKIVGGITVYPNPVTGKLINIKFSEMSKGIYQLRLINAIGQVVFIQQLTHPGGSGIKTIGLGNIPAGNYQLEIIKPDNTKVIITLNIPG